MGNIESAMGEPVRLEPKSSGQYVPGGFWWRFLAALIDGFIVGIINMPVSFAAVFVQGFDISSGAGPELNEKYFLMLALQYIVQFVTIFFYYGWFYSKKGATPGKMVCGLRVMHAETGANLSYWRTFGRETLGKFISTVTLLIGFMMAGWTKEKTGLHDLMFQSRVVRKVTK